MKSNLCAVISALLLTGLAGCGGGGGGGVEPPSTTRAEGAYSGSMSGSPWDNALTMVVLENDEAWILYGIQSIGSFNISGFMHGRGTSTGSAFTVSSLRDYESPWTTYLGSLSASYVQGGFLDGSMTYPVSFRYPYRVDFATTAAAPYSYDTPASLTSLAGVWRAGIFGAFGYTTVEANGVLRVENTDSSGSVRCVTTGRVTPRASRKNVFDLTMQIGPTPCEAPNSTARGIAIVLPGSSPQLVMMAVVDGNDSVGVFGYGGR